MPDRQKLYRVGFVLVVLALVFPRDAYAYLDPGTGSLVIQTVIAAVAAAAYAVRSYWGRIRTLFVCKSRDSSH